MNVRAAVSGALSAVLLLCGASCSEPTLGEMPALCASDGSCPAGYDCIHGVCAAPGTPIPSTVDTLASLRASDLRVVPEESGVLVVWETYAYSVEGQKFVGARVRADGSVSSRMDIVGRFVAEEDSLEPYFDVLSVAPNKLLVGISAASLADDVSALPRVVTYRVDLPPEGKEEQSPVFEAAWPEELHMETVGYGAVSVPRLLGRTDHVELGYVRSRTAIENGMPATIAELAVFSMAQDGVLLSPMPTYYPARDNLTVAVGVMDAFALSTGAYWILDNERPSAVFVQDGVGAAEVPLGRLAIPVYADDKGLAYIEPSKRLGEKLATDEVSGAAELRFLSAPTVGMPSMPMETVLASLDPIRDTPRLAWAHREGAPSILVSPGASIDAPSLRVYLVDLAASSASLAMEIPRLSSRTIDAVSAEVVAGKLFVVWLESEEDYSVIRARVVPEP